VPTALLPFPTNAKLRRNRVRAARAAAAAADGAAAAPADPHAQAYAALARMEAFLQWLSRALMASLYPGAPFERKHFALELLLLLLGVWGEPAWASKAAAAAAAANGSGGEEGAEEGRGAAGGEGARERARLVAAFQPFDSCLLSSAATTALIGGVVDSRDKLRAGERASLSGAGTTVATCWSVPLSACRPLRLLAAEPGNAALAPHTQVRCRR
jgi:hypothetical protein